MSHIRWTFGRGSCQEWRERAVGSVLANVQLEIQGPEESMLYSNLPSGKLLWTFGKNFSCSMGLMGGRGRAACAGVGGGRWLVQGGLDQITGNKKTGIWLLNFASSLGARCSSTWRLPLKGSILLDLLSALRDDVIKMRRNQTRYPLLCWAVFQDTRETEPSRPW